MKKIVLFLIAAALTGCAAVKNDKNTAESVAENQETLEVSTGRAQGSTIGENRDFFIGADITEDTNIDGIDAFEEKISPHEVYADEIYIDETEKAESFMLECYSRGKMPYIILKNREGISDEDFKKYAGEFAEAVGKYDIEVMIEILENSYYYDENGEKYKYAAKLIKKSNEQAKTVWSVKRDDIILVGSYMPDENVDYICINGYFSSTEDAQRMFSEIRSHLDTDKKAIFRFGAAAYSTDDCVYRTDEAIETINLVYESVKKDPNAAGIIYMDKNTKLSDKVRYTDYSVTTDKKLSAGYKEIIDNAILYRQEKEMKE